MATASIGQIRWRCRRGMRELDVLLRRFADQQYASLDERGQTAFAGLLEASDDDLYAWLMGRSRPTDPVLCALIERIRGGPARG